jgi:hypothetical protein
MTKNTAYEPTILAFKMSGSPTPKFKGTAHLNAMQNELIECATEKDI